MTREDMPSLVNQEARNVYNIQCNFLTYFKIVKAIPRKWKHVLEMQTKQCHEYELTLYEKIIRTQKVPRFVY